MNGENSGTGARELLTVEYGMVYDTAQANLSGMTHEHSLVQPDGGGNCANWILSHLVYVQNKILATLGEPPVWESDALAAPRSAPIADADDAIPWDGLCERFLGSRDRCLDAIAGMSDAALAEQVPGLAGGAWSVAQLLAFLAFHQGYHVGQLGLTRRMAGLEGAIKGPAPT